MNILVTGATGRLGTTLLPRLAGAGYAVRVMSRTARQSSGAEWVRADLATGEGLAEAVTGVEAVVHLASAPYKRGYTRQVDVAGTRRLVAAAKNAGVRHLLYVSIVGIDRVPWPYFRVKLAAEDVVATAGVPWTTVRATQFHSFIDEILGKMSRLPVIISDPTIPAQPVDVRDVADHLVVRLATPPRNGLEAFAGPEVLRFDDMLPDWLAIRQMHKEDTADPRTGQDGPRAPVGSAHHGRPADRSHHLAGVPRE